jgi:NAD(P)-dependent dehydrogenase (short-subunit alcohol dehydrogenase family)
MQMTTPTGRLAGKTALITAAGQGIGRGGKAEEIAALALCPASDESAFTTGQTHVIDDGWAV